jgi:hypothetical protein
MGGLRAPATGRPPRARSAPEPQPAGAGRTVGGGSGPDGAPQVAGPRQGPASRPARVGARSWSASRARAAAAEGQPPGSAFGSPPGPLLGAAGLEVVVPPRLRRKAAAAEGGLPPARTAAHRRLARRAQEPSGAARGGAGSEAPPSAGAWRPEAVRHAPGRWASPPRLAVHLALPRGSRQGARSRWRASRHPAWAPPQGERRGHGRTAAAWQAARGAAWGGHPHPEAGEARRNWLSASIPHLRRPSLATLDPTTPEIRAHNAGA